MADKVAPPASSTPPPAKFSRYRSVRQTLPPSGPPRVEQNGNGDMSRTKSMSRYKRSRVAFQVDENEPLPPMPAVPMSAIQHPSHYTNNPSNGRTTMRRVTEPIMKGQSQAPRTSPRNSNSQAELRRLMEASRQNPSRRPETEDERLRRKIREYQERETGQQRAQRERDELERAYQLQKANAGRALHNKRSQAEQFVQKPRTEAEQARFAEEEAKRLLEEQKRKDLERLQKELDAAPSPMAIKSPTGMREKFGFFSRKGSTKDTLSQTTSTTTSTTSPPISMAPKTTKEVPRHVQQFVLSQAPQSAKETALQVERPTPSQASKKNVEFPQQIQQGGGGIVPQTDAPISASNAGERRVLVRCKQSSVNLPVTPETTPKEIIYSTANFMTQNIIPSTAILIESYTQLGLERRVRRYEHVRDVMNSWDRDTQNAFHLMNSDTPKFDTDLELSGVPKEVPADVTVYMYHSQKPGTWVKRYITLLSSGQVFVHKKNGAKIGDKHTIPICHLSDFDIYTPTPQQLRKVLKPPKKHCHAVKSQQKTAVFLSTENFVHFFSTDDEQLSEKWYDAVQRWRSWYLVNKMGGGKKAKKAPEAKVVKDVSPLGNDRESNPYVIGTFAGLGLEGFKSGPEEDLDMEDEDRPRQIPFHLRNSVLISNTEALRELKRHPPPVSYRLPLGSEEEFASSGLLGRSYTTRQQKAKEAAESQPSGPFTEGPSLLNRDSNRTMSMRSRSQSQSNGTKRPETSAGLQSAGLARSDSRAKPKPLLDFTPTFKEPPQWDKTGKGHGVAPQPGVPLVEVATTPDHPLQDVTKATVFRRETTVARPVTRDPKAGGEAAFVKGGLVSGVGASVSGSGSGSGASVMNRGRVRHDS